MVFIAHASATLPFIIGVHTSLEETIDSLPLEQHVSLNLDSDELVTPFNDAEVLPAQFVRRNTLFSKIESMYHLSIFLTIFPNEASS